ncbi:hypothetical protein BN1221_00274 [Brenneria goodwinii]|uniref:Uncharacterized protein n=1 Tax=Brenneria goodwinii TaxID=1109412 RepID=A0A0G4JPM3_9GAMM|nr:hypothetical protein BN1221_00274 [Brenneria goodwinii]
MSPLACARSAQQNNTHCVNPLAYVYNPSFFEPRNLLVVFPHSEIYWVEYL